jgi:RNA 3'-terminal phosphate cyclase-like protein
MPFEMNLLELIEKVTNGCQMSISKTGTRLIFRPGIIDSNDGVEVTHECNLVRNITYYLEVICMLGVFGKTELNVTLEGNTDDLVDQSVDSF